MGAIFFMVYSPEKCLTQSRKERRGESLELMKNGFVLPNSLWLPAFALLDSMKGLTFIWGLGRFFIDIILKESSEGCKKCVSGGVL